MLTGISSGAFKEVEDIASFDCLETVKQAISAGHEVVQIYLNEGLWDPKYLDQVMSVIAVNPELKVVIHMPNMPKSNRERADFGLYMVILEHLRGLFDNRIKPLIHYEAELTVDGIPLSNKAILGLENSLTRTHTLAAHKEHMEGLFQLRDQTGSFVVFDAGRPMYPQPDATIEEVQAFITETIERLDPKRDVIHMADKGAFDMRFHEDWKAFLERGGVAAFLFEALVEFADKGGIIIFEHENYRAAFESVANMRLVELAKDLRSGAREFQLDHFAYPLIDDRIAITLPCLEEVQSAGVSFSINPGMFMYVQILNTWNEIFEEHKSEWTEFFVEVDRRKQIKHNADVISPVYSIFGLITNNQKWLASVCESDSTLSRLPELLKNKWFERYDTFIQQYDDVVEIINLVIQNPVLRERWIEILEIEVPAWSLDQELNKNIPSKLMADMGIESPAVVDMGCGDGEHSLKVADSIDGELSAFDRKYIEFSHSQFWKDERRSNSHFFIADTMDSPLRSEYADCVIIGAVTAYQTREGLFKTLREARRLLREGRLLLIGPQAGNHFGGYRVFMKEGINLREITDPMELKREV